MPRTLTLTSLLLFCGCLARQTHPAIYEAMLPEEPGLIELAVSSDRFLVAEVEVAGRPLNFIVDTGAPTSVLDDEVAAALGLTAIGTTPIADFQGRRLRLPVVRVPVMRLGGVEVRDVGMVVSDLSASSRVECKPIAGILGNNVMRGAVELDIGAGRVRLGSSMAELGARAGGSSGMAYPPTYNINLPPAVATFIPSPVALDTGSPMAITVTRAVDRKLGVGAALAVETTVGGVHGDSPDSVQMRIYPWPRTPVGGLDLAGVWTLGGAGSTTIGLAVLRSFVVRMDREARTVTFWPGEQPLRRGLESFGLGLGVRGDGAVVTWLVAGSPASEVGLRFGERVVALDGVKLQGQEPQARCLAVRDLARREQVRVSVVRDGRVVELALVRRALVPVSAAP